MSEATIFNPTVASDAYAAIQTELTAIPAQLVAAVNVNVQEAARVALGLAMWAQQPDLLQELASGSAGLFTTGHTERLAQAAWATWHCHVRYLTAEQQHSAARLPASLAEQAKALNARMLALVTYYLGAREDVEPEIVGIRGGTGHLDTANDLVRLATLLDTHRAVLEQDTVHYRPGDADEARQVAAAIMASLDPKENELEFWAGQRARAYTLLRRTYEEVRTLAAFVFRDSPERVDGFPPLVAAVRRSSRGRPASPEVSDAAATTALEA